MPTPNDRFYHYIPRQGHGLPHDPFYAIVGPRPIGWISTRSRDGVLNLAPYSFFNAFSHEPPIIGFSSEGRKDTLRNIEATGEFVWNLATRSLAEAMNQSSAVVAPEVDEFRLANLTPLDSQLVTPPRVSESPVAMECKRTQIVPILGLDGRPSPSYLVLGEVIAVHIEHSLLKNGIYDTAAGQPIMRGGGTADYFAIEAAQHFRMPRPK